MSETLTHQYPTLADFLACDWGILRSATTDRDPAARERRILEVLFADKTEYRCYIYSADEARRAYSQIVDYVKNFCHNYARLLDDKKIYCDIGYGAFRATTNDLKRDPKLFEPDLPPIDLNKEAETLGLSRAAALEAMQREAAKAATRRKASARRLRWGKDNRQDENPAAFAWRAYQAEARAGTLHLGIIRKDDRQNGTTLAVKLVSWLRTPANRERVPEGFYIPTKPEWNTRQLEAGKAKQALAVRPRSEEQRLYEVEVARRRRARHASPTLA